MKPLYEGWTDDLHAWIDTTAVGQHYRNLQRDRDVLMRYKHTNDVAELDARIQLLFDALHDDWRTLNGIVPAERK